MWVRLTAMLLCIVFFITGCNSLISQFFGTHKLRVFTMEETITTGVGDSDFVELIGAWQSGDYIVVPPRTDADKAILIYPLLAESQIEALKAGKQVKPRIIAWTKNFSMACDDEKNCVPLMPVAVQGVIREMRQQKNQAHLLPVLKYQLPDNVEYIEVGRQPLAWYWNLLMVLGGLGFAFYIESRANREQQISGKEEL